MDKTLSQLQTEITELENDIQILVSKFIDSNCKDEFSISDMKINLAGDMVSIIVSVGNNK
jgi:hypothetical protein